LHPRRRRTGAPRFASKPANTRETFILWWGGVVHACDPPIPRPHRAERLGGRCCGSRLADGARPVTITHDTNLGASCSRPPAGQVRAKPAWTRTPGAWYVDKARGHPGWVFSAPSPTRPFVRFTGGSWPGGDGRTGGTVRSAGCRTKAGVAALHVTPGWSRRRDSRGCATPCRDGPPRRPDPLFPADELTRAVPATGFETRTGRSGSSTGLAQPVRAPPRNSGLLHRRPVPEGTSLFAAIRALHRPGRSGVRRAQRGGFEDALYLPDDRNFPTLWGIATSAQTVNGVAAPRVWTNRPAADAGDLHRGSRGTWIVTVIDHRPPT